MYRSKRRGNSFRVPLKSSPGDVSSKEHEKPADTDVKSVIDEVYSSDDGPARESTMKASPTRSQSNNLPSTSYTSLVGAIAPGKQTEDSNQDHHFPKAKRLHLDLQDCMDHSNSEDGGKALTQPTQVMTSSKDPNRGLYPRPQRPKNRAQGFSVQSTHGEFVKASDMGLSLPASVQARLGQANDNASLPMPQLPSTNRDGEMAQYGSYNRGRPPYQRKRKMIGNQSNTLKTYFSHSPSQPPSQREDTADAIQNMNLPIGISPMDFDGDISLVEDHAIINDQSSPKAGSTDQSTRYKTQYNIKLPDLPTIIPPSPQNTSQRLTLKGTKRKGGTTSSNSKVKGTPKQIGPSSHNLWKASFLYDAELAKPKAEPKPKSQSQSDKYGLLGSGNYPATQRDAGGSFFDILPYEIIENIFCRLPMMDLYLNVNRVCLAWNDIISDTGFLPWKKRYHKLKAVQTEEKQFMQTLLTTNKMTSLENFLPELVRYMKDFKKITAADMDGCLSKHSKYKYAQALVDERFKECIGGNKVPNPWCIIAALVIVSEYVADVQEIYQVLLSSTSHSTAYEVIECLYCLATFFLAFTSAHINAPWNGMHYRLYYALYLLENESTTTSDQLQDAASHGRGGQQSLIKYTSGSTVVQMTHEQLRICNHNVKDGDIIKIVAFAGTGKTTTLVKYTRLRPNLRFLLVVFNKSVQQHAKTKFPVYVTCKTGHALAFQYVGRKYAANKKLGRSALKVTNILPHMTACKGESLYVQAKFIIVTLNKFMASADPFITTAHVPEESVDENNRRKPISHQHRMHYSEQATALWEKMVDMNNPQIQITHDTYLKLYQLQRPKIYGYDVILIDEAQDMTPALADVLLHQRQAKILVGDPHQQIYGFRGAVNAMQQVPDSQTFYLTQSFRFGSEIAFLAASCLSILKGEKRKTLVGNASTGSIRGGVEGQLAIITRSNFTLFNEAVKKCCYSSTPETVAFVGGTESFGFEMILDIYALMASADGVRNINNKFIAGFSTVGELEKYAIKTSDTELLGKIRIVKTHHHGLPSLISKIRSRCINDTDIADIVLSTAHKAKGLEFSTVRLTDDYQLDFAAILGRETGPQVEADESNLLYVAATRAKQRLILTSTLKLLLSHAGERFVYPALTKKLTTEGVVMECECTGAPFDPCALTLVKHSVCLGEQYEKKEVFYSPETVHREMTAVRYLYGRPGEEDEVADIGDMHDDDMAELL